MTRFFVIAIFFLASCQDHSGFSAQHKNAASTDKTAFAIYSELMDQILVQSVGNIATGTSYRPGELNPYRKGFPGFPHKALAACMVWDVEKVDVSYKNWFTSGSRDWNHAAVGALNNCQNYRRQKSLNCKCQVLDHDDINVLEVPSEFRSAYESGAKIVNANMAPAVKKNGQRYILDMEWENVLAQRSVFPVSVFKNGGSGTLNSLAPINGANCTGKYDVASNGIGDWEISCDDGVKAVGSLRAKGPNKGSDGSGFDSRGNKITFALIPVPSN